VKQRALTPGVLSNPYRFVEAGEEFEHETAMKWAVPVDQPAVEKPAGKRKRAEQAEPAGSEADPI
jgi:hypothetical protein